MANGKHGDHPYTDIVSHGLPVYSPAIDALVRKVAGLADTRTTDRIAEMLLTQYWQGAASDLAGLERRLIPLVEELERDATRRGWESES